MSPLPTSYSSQSVAAAFYRIQHVQTALVWQSIGPESRRTYQSAWSRWKEYTLLIGSDPLLSRVPREFFAQGPVTLTFREQAMIGFYVYLRCNRKCIPETLASYTSAVKFMLRACKVSDAGLLTPSVLAARQGFALLWRAEPGNSAADRETLPFTVDMIMRTVKTLLPSAAYDIAQMAQKTALMTNFTFLLRAGESVYQPQVVAHHHLKANAVVFVLQDEDNVEFSCTSDKAHLYAARQLRAVIADVKDAKNDQDGSGHRFQIAAQNAASSSNSSLAFDIARQMFDCASLLRPGPDDPFFSSPASGYVLKEDVMNKLLQNGACLFGFDPTRFSMHSLRVAGASVMGAMGVPAWYIQKAGRWKSTKFMKYIRMSSSMYQRVIAQLSNTDLLSANDVVRYHPGAGVSLPSPAESW